MTRWTLSPWGAVRVAGLPAGTLDGLRLGASASAAAALASAEAALGPLRDQAGHALFEAVRDNGDAATRRVALELKRRVFNAKELSAAHVAQSEVLPVAIRTHVAHVAEAEAHRRALAEAFEDTFAAEWRAISARLRHGLVDERLLGGLVLSSADHLEMARRLTAIAPDAPRKAGQQIRESTIARYVFRAALRTTPFATFASVGLVRWDDTRTRDVARPSLRGVCQLNAPLLGALLEAHTDERMTAQRALRVTPLLRRDPGPPASLVFARAAWTRGGIRMEWQSLGESDAVMALLRAASGRSTDEMATALASAELDADAWRDAIGQLIGAGFLECTMPEVSLHAGGVAALAEEAAAAGNAALADRLRTVACAVARYPDANAVERERCLAEIGAQIEAPEGARTALYEDVVIDGLGPDHVPIDAARLREDLEPVLALARSSGCGAAYRLVTGAFVAQYGEGGRCDDVPGFLTMLLQNAAFMKRLRSAADPVSWHASRLGSVVSSARGDVLELEPHLFAELPGAGQSGSVATFVQLAARNREAFSQGDYRVVLNGVQSGRNKYISRYLGSGGAADRALADVRADFGNARGPLAVELRPMLGQNFQVHPRLTEWSFELPLEPGEPHDRCLRLADLTLSFDAVRKELRLHAARIGRDVEPIHLGFLRDPMLPDAIFLLRALSPRLRDETLAERMDLYASADQMRLAHGSAPCDRPRLTIGRLVLERAQWVFAAAEVPAKSPKESYASYFRAIDRWRLQRGLPERGFARPVARATLPSDLAASRQYVDWMNPFCLIGLQRLLGAGPAETTPADRWVVFTELLPEPEHASFALDGRSHVAEYVFQWEREERP